MQPSPEPVSSPTRAHKHKPTTRTQNTPHESIRKPEGRRAVGRGSLRGVWGEGSDAGGAAGRGCGAARRMRRCSLHVRVRAGGDKDRRYGPGLGREVKGDRSSGRYTRRGARMARVARPGRAGRAAGVGWRMGGCRNSTGKTIAAGPCRVGSIPTRRQQLTPAATGNPSQAAERHPRSRIPLPRWRARAGPGHGRRSPAVLPLPLGESCPGRPCRRPLMVRPAAGGRRRGVRRCRLRGGCETGRGTRLPVDPRSGAAGPTVGCRGRVPDPPAAVCRAAASGGRGAGPGGGVAGSRAGAGSGRSRGSVVGAVWGSGGGPRARVSRRRRVGSPVSGGWCRRLASAPTAVYRRMPARSTARSPAAGLPLPQGECCPGAAGCGRRVGAALSTAAGTLRPNGSADGG